jgi:solute carrier family 13 (sodium-dependent dicarboxylate transporter), member 2/3/5
LLTAFLSMWMSNIAAAALMLACLRPVLQDLNPNNAMRRALLIGVALGADLGGISTPIGTGPNAIAISSLSSIGQNVSFLGWMIFALPLAAGMLLAGFGLILWRVERKQNDWTSELGRLNHIYFDNKSKRQSNGELVFLSVLAGTILMWLTEPWHHIPAAVVSLGATSLLFLTGTLQKDDLLKIDWSTLILIAGGITLGKLLEQAQIIEKVAEQVPFSTLHPVVGLFLLCLASATLAAVMSNTATAIMLIPLALALIHQPSTAILVAIAASFGIPFVISTPPNAMVYGEGGVKFNDLFLPGIVLMIFGCLLISLTGKFVLNLIGIP